MMNKGVCIYYITLCFVLLCGNMKCDQVRVCPGGFLDIQCKPGEVIVTESAKFGRMEFTECTMVKDFIGCQNDVLYIADKRCSGRQSCHVVIPNKELLQANKACSPYLQMYLQMNYSCLGIVSSSEVECQRPKASTEREGVLTSRVCATVKSPWKIQAMSGQKIRLKIIDFGSEHFNVENKTANFPIYGYILDGSKRVQFTGSLERERLLYESKSNELSVEILPEVNDLGFLIQYQKIGCPDLIPPAHAWYKRDGDQAVIGCEWSQKTWHLSCDGHSWSGVVGNCSEMVTQSPPLQEKTISNPSVLWLVCLVSVSVVVVVVVCVIGVVCVKKYRIKQDVQKMATLQLVPGQGHYDLDPNIEMASMLYLPYKISDEQQQQQGTLSDPHRPTSYLIPQDQVVNELTPIRIWERPLPDIPVKPLATCGTVRSGRTPGDGDEAVGIPDIHESTTLQSQRNEHDAKPLHAGPKYSSLPQQVA